MLVIKTDVTYTVTHQTTHILPPAGPPKRSRREPQEAVRTASRWSRARGIDDGVPAMGPDEGPGSKTRAEAAVWGHGEPRARKTALGREELLYKNPAWVLSWQGKGNDQNGKAGNAFSERSEHRPLGPPEALRPGASLSALAADRHRDSDAAHQSSLSPTSDGRLQRSQE